MSKYNEHQKKSIYNYRKKTDSFQLTLPKGKKDIIKEHASMRGESMNAFINRAIDETLENDK